MKYFSHTCIFAFDTTEPTVLYITCLLFQGSPEKKKTLMASFFTRTTSVHQLILWLPARQAPITFRSWPLEAAPNNGGSYMYQTSVLTGVEISLRCEFNCP
ncbi:hypothetical protein AMECASPLE_025523 [Ameca splendens]|uniref:Uncharacterized protein n=1 Tax=Ameca splendens TaxID=208324 RepID=A0ABV1A1Q2_9TELE